MSCFIFRYKQQPIINYENQYIIFGSNKTILKTFKGQLKNYIMCKRSFQSRQKCPNFTWQVVISLKHIKHHISMIQNKDI